VVRGGNNTLLSVGLRADDTRGSSLGQLGAAGPHLGAAHLQSIGEAGTLEWEGGVTSLAHPSLGALTVAESAGRARVDARPGATVLSAELGERVAVAVTEPEETGDVESFGRLGLAWPLVRAFGGVTRQWLHWVEPWAESSFFWAHRQGPWVELPDGSAVSLLVGLRSALGRLGARGALATSIRAGWVGPPEAPDRVVAGTLGVTTEYVALAARAHWRWGDPQAFESSGHARIGRLDGLNLQGYVEGRTRFEPLVARLVSPDPWRRLVVGWLDRSGWTAGGEALVPWTRWLSSSVGLDWDLIRPRWLGWRSGVAYRHPCGCLGLVGGASERVGRRGVDAWLSVQLVP
jgi:hypothetical protein